MIPSTEMHPNTNSESRLLTGIFVALVAVISLTVVFGWAYDILIMKTLLPGRPDMKANAAICFFMMAIAVSLSRWKVMGREQLIVAQFFGLIALTVSVLVALEYAFNVDLGIDQLIFSDPGGPSAHSPPGRFSPMTAMNFILLSTALLLETWPRRHWYYLSQSLCLISFLVSFQSFLGGALGLSEIFGMHLFIPMAVPTSFNFSLLAASLLLSRSRVGLMDRFTQKTPSAAMARTMLAAVLLVPPLIRGLATLGANLEFYSEGFGVFLQAIGSAAFMATIVITSAGAFLRAEQEREKLRVRERAALSEAEAERDKLYSLFRQAPTHVNVFKGPDHIYELVHPSTAALNGENDLSGKKLRDSYPQNADQSILGAADDVYQTGEPYRATEVEFLSASGELHYFDTTIQAWRSASGVIQGVIIFSADVTDQVKARHAIQEANEAKSQFLANVSHEIRTPLGIILGFSDLALESLDHPKTADYYLQSIRRNAEELSKLIGEVLDLSKIEAHKLELEKITFEFEPWLNGIRELFEIKAREKGIRLEVVCEGPLPKAIVTDPTRLRQIVVNLLGNAIKFTNEGSVNLSVAASNSPTNAEVAELRFTVQDTGIGISRSQVTHLFQPFSQGDGSMNRRFGGTGLGLSISRELAQALGGTLTLKDSSPGFGSTFELAIEVDIPSAKAWEMGQTSAAERSPVSISLDGLRILIVEDSVDNQILITHYLKTTNAVTTIANNGAEALEKLASASFDVILMDIQMPVLDGFRTVRALRDRGITTPTIALTAHAMEEERERAKKSGFDDYLTKPVNRSVLLHTLQSYRQMVEGRGDSI